MGSPGQPPWLSYSSWTLNTSSGRVTFYIPCNEGGRVYWNDSVHLCLSFCPCVSTLSRTSSEPLGHLQPNVMWWCITMSWGVCFFFCFSFFCLLPCSFFFLLPCSFFCLLPCSFFFLLPCSFFFLLPCSSFFTLSWLGLKKNTLLRLLIVTDPVYCRMLQAGALRQAWPRPERCAGSSCGTWAGSSAGKTPSCTARPGAPRSRHARVSWLTAFSSYTSSLPPPPTPPPNSNKLGMGAGGGYWSLCLPLCPVTLM